MPLSPIHFVLTCTSIGGTERLTCTLTREFCRRGYDANLYISTHDSRPLQEWCRTDDVSPILHPAFPNADMPHTAKTTLATAQYFRALPKGLINVHYGDNFISLKDIIAMRLAGQNRIIAQVNHPTPWNAENEQKRKMTRLGAALCRHIVTISGATRQVLVEAGVPPQKITVIPCGVRPPAQPVDKVKARRDLGLPPDSFLVGTLTRLTPYKRIDLLIEAVASLPNNVFLAVAGEGKARAEWEAQARRHLGSRALFLGHVHSSEKFYGALDVFALPSEMEGFGLVYIEAAFHAVPSVGTNVGGIPDAVTDGETGLLVSVNDRQALIQALQTMLDPKVRHRLGTHAQKKAYAEFTDQRMVDQYEALFQKYQK